LALRFFQDFAPLHYALAGIDDHQIMAISRSGGNKIFYYERIEHPGLLY
jgi:hypothetical protein